jgi:hypothetical protein
MVADLGADENLTDEGFCDEEEAGGVGFRVPLLFALLLLGGFGGAWDLCPSSSVSDESPSPLP